MKTNLELFEAVIFGASGTLQEIQKLPSMESLPLNSLIKAETHLRVAHAACVRLVSRAKGHREPKDR